MRSHWVWLAAILSVYSAWDYYEHISRPGSAFEQAPGEWFAFSLSSHVSFFMVAYLAAKALARMKMPALIADTLGVASAVAAHLLVTGPLWDRLFWNGGLTFNSVLTPVLIACALYLFYRLAFAFIVRPRGPEPESLP